MGDRAAQAILAARLEEARRRAESRFRGAFDNAPIGVSISQVGPDGIARYVEVNAAQAAICGYPMEELLQRPFSDFTHPDDRHAEAERMLALYQGSATEIGGEKRIVRPDGEIRWVQVRGAPLGDGVYVGQMLDITERKRFETELEHMATHDALTGVMNRRSFEAALETALAGVRRHGDQAAIVTLDVDNFKHVNDTYGHAAGDEVLRSAAHALQQRLRVTDQIGRLGGDEFGAILNRTDARAARGVAEDLLEALRDLRVPVGDRSVRLTVSAGLRTLARERAIGRGRAALGGRHGDVRREGARPRPSDRRASRGPPAGPLPRAHPLVGAHPRRARGGR